MNPSVLATTVSASHRISALRSAFGIPLICALVEHGAFAALSRLSVPFHGKAYAGGYWEYVTLSNGGFYMHPAAETEFCLFSPGNGSEEIVSAEAAGIIATLFSLSSLAMRYPKLDVLADRYHQLLDFSRGREDFVAIASVID